ncbi:aminoglycoside phosphotransferase family protein [Oceanobacillus polygoni]|uniref:Aminoglycoside phosphotransferase (APT) family kinase protein n=1 Tax=Oceanobacillus polygoni TaxID=1235259 RepID=A0A9X1CB29_9BACI|nr:aminoglycoside phosphotransferase family protein [Oceanobacillus polygoni]MBP2077274.1 aminoglycoside phosphotransferase (APT) family kinase protein [Oceanobacillus polygoni]
MSKTLINQIPLISNCKEVIEIKKGFSSDEKYLIHMQEGNNKLLLRMFNLKELELKKEEYSILKRMQDYNITCSQPISIGEVGNRGYMVTSYIEGKDAEDEIPKYSEEEQYNIGIEAGKELRKMHQLAAPKHISSWYSRKVEKHKKYLDAYLACEVKVKNDHQIMNFIDENIQLMKQRPNLFQHDDFHLGNIIVNNKKFAGVIDFNRYDWGDPIHEFLKIGIFSREVSIPFSIGQIRGYFNNKEPDEDFWRLYSLYLAMCVFSTVIWTLNTIPNNMNEMLDKVYMYLEDHEYFSRLKPKWYQ